MEPADSSFTFFSYTKNVAGGRQDFTTSRLDKNGNLLQNKNHNINNLDYAAYLTGYRQFILATKCSYFATANLYGTSSGTIILNKVNKTTLDTMFTKYYDDGLYRYSLNNFIKFNENKYYLIGGKGNTMAQWPVIFHLDSNLNIINIITINTSLNFNCNNAVYNPINKKILLGGYKINTSNQVDLDFVEIDTLGTITNTMVIGNLYLGIEQLKYCSFDNSYIFNGAKRTSKYGSNDMCRLNITKLDATNLTVAWNKTYGSAAITNNCNSLVINNDGSIVTCGRYADSTSLPLMNYDTKGILLKVNALGDSLWMHQYNNYMSPSNPSNYHETFFGIEKTNDGGYIACGGVINKPQGKAWVVKTDSLGCVSAGCGSIINGTLTTGISQLNADEENFVTLFPNPVNDVLNIRLRNMKDDITIKLYNNLGELTRKEKVIFNNHTASLDIKDLAKDIFCIRLYSNGELIATQKFIKN